MGDRRSYGGGRDRAADSRSGATREGERSQRSLLVGVGFFVVAIIIIGALLLSGGDDDNDPEQGVVVGESTSTSPSTASGTTPDATDTLTSPSSTATTAVGTATSTTEPAESTATTESEPTSTVSDETDEEPTPTQEDVAAEEPEPTEEPIDEEPEPVEEEPFIGEFGTLPPAQIVSGGQSRPLSLDYELAASLSAAPSSAPVYLLDWPAWTETDVATIAANLDLSGEVEGGPGNYQVFGETGEIYFTGPTIQYVNTGSLPDLALGTDSSVIAAASAWIYANDFISDDLDGGVIIGRDDDAGRAVVLFRPGAVSPILSFVPSATVTVGPGDTVLEANIRWPSDYIASDYGLRSGDALWNKVLAGEAAVEADLSGVGGSGALSGTMTVYDISLAYSYAGSPGSDEFLVPLLVFSGEATIAETGDVVPVSLYVAAVAGQVTPQG